MAAAMYKLWVAEASLAEVVDFINTSKALTIITGILVSVVVAFIAGSVVQYLVRLVFTFHFERMYRRLGGIFGGISITAIFYFLIMKGAAGASFMRPEWLAWINGNTDTILLTMLIGFQPLSSSASSPSTSTFSASSFCRARSHWRLPLPETTW